MTPPNHCQKRGGGVGRVEGLNFTCSTTQVPALARTTTVPSLVGIGVGMAPFTGKGGASGGEGGRFSPKPPPTRTASGEGRKQDQPVRGGTEPFPPRTTAATDPF